MIKDLAIKPIKAIIINNKLKIKITHRNLLFGEYHVDIGYLYLNIRDRHIFILILEIDEDDRNP